MPLLAFAKVESVSTTLIHRAEFVSNETLNELLSGSMMSGRRYSTGPVEHSARVRF